MDKSFRQYVDEQPPQRRAEIRKAEKLYLNNQRRKNYGVGEQDYLYSLDGWVDTSAGGRRAHVRPSLSSTVARGPTGR